MLPKYEIDMDKEIATKLKKELKIINTDIKTHFQLMPNMASLGTLKISVETIGNLPEKLNTLKQIHLLLNKHRSEIVNFAFYNR